LYLLFVISLLVISFVLSTLWLMAAGTALCVVPTTGRWRAGVFSR